MIPANADYVCGAECGAAGVGTLSAGREHTAAIGTVAPTIVTSGPATMLSTRCWRHNLAGQADNWRRIALSAAAAVVVVRFKWYAASLPGAFVRPIFIDGISPAGLLFDNTTSTIVAQNSVGTWGGAAADVVTGRWYMIDFRVNCGVSETVDAVITDLTDMSTQTIGPATRTATARTTTAFTMGLFTGGGNVTAEWFIDDIIVSLTSGDYPIGEGTVFGSYPVSDGTHGGGWASGVFGKGSGGTNAAANTDTDIWASLDNPLSTTVAGNAVGDLTGVLTTNYVEFVMNNLPAAASINGVMVTAASHSTSTTASNFDLRLADSSAGASASLISADLSETTITLPSVARGTDRAGSAWTPTLINDARIRFSSTDSNPDVFLDGVCIEVDYVPGVSDQAASISPAIFTLTPIALDEVVGDASRTLTPVNFTLTPVALAQSVGGAISSFIPTTITLTPVALTRGVDTTTSSISPVVITLTLTALTRGVDTTTSSITPMAMTLTPIALTKVVGDASGTITSVIFTLTPISMTSSVGGVIRSISPVTLTLTSVVITRGIDTASYTISPVMITLTPILLTSSVGAVTTSITSVTFTLSAFVLTGFTESPNEGNIVPVTFTLSPISLIQSVGAISTSMSPASMVLNPELLTTSVGTISRSLTPVEISVIAVSLTVADGTTYYTLSPVIIELVPQALTQSIGSTSRDLTPVIFTFIPVVLTESIGTVSFTITPITIILDTIPLTYSIGTTTHSISPVIFSLIAIVVSQNQGGKPYVFDGVDWIIKPVKYWTGVDWIEKPMKVWTGSSWELV